MEPAHMKVDLSDLFLKRTTGRFSDSLIRKTSKNMYIRFDEIHISINKGEVQAKFYWGPLQGPITKSRSLLDEGDVLVLSGFVGEVEIGDAL